MCFVLVLQGAEGTRIGLYGYPMGTRKYLYGYPEGTLVVPGGYLDPKNELLYYSYWMVTSFGTCDCILAHYGLKSLNAHISKLPPPLKTGLNMVQICIKYIPKGIV